MRLYTLPAMPFRGVRVIDLSRLLPGPYATGVLAGLGADVIKVEDTGTGDGMRSALLDEGDGSVMFSALNRGKRSLRLDIAAPAGRELLLRLAEVSDVLVEGFRPGVLERLDLGWDVLHRRSPRLVLCRLSGYGQDGPDRGRAGHDVNYLARAGVLAAGASSAGRPAIPGVPVADLAGAWACVAAVLAALHRVGSTGEGCQCDIAMVDAMLSWLGPHRAAVAAGLAPASGPWLLSGALPCYRLYRCADGWMSVGALEKRFWARLCELLGVPHLAARGRDTGAAAEQVAAELERVFATRTRGDWTEFLQDEDVCCEPVLDVEEAARHPQARHRAGAGAPEMSWSPLRLDGLSATAAAPAPQLGEHSREVLAELGVAEAEWRRLVEAGVTA